MDGKRRLIINNLEVQIRQWDHHAQNKTIKLQRMYLYKISIVPTCHFKKYNHNWFDLDEPADQTKLWRSHLSQFPNANSVIWNWKTVNALAIVYLKIRYIVTATMFTAEIVKIIFKVLSTVFFFGISSKFIKNFVMFYF